MITQIRSKQEIKAMRQGGRILATVLEKVVSQVVDGVSTKELANFAAAELKSLGGRSSFLGYHGFPDVICISLNEEIVHGIPGKRVLQNGDIVSLDFGVTYDGMITDGATSLIVGDTKHQLHKDLVKFTKLALEAGIGAVHDGARVGDISAAVEATLKPHGYGIPKDLVGHAVGRQLWELPNIPNYGRPQTGPWLEAGMTIAIEPMVTLGSSEIITDNDGWTVKTIDGSWAAHFEHTVLVLPEGAEVLTVA